MTPHKTCPMCNRKEYDRPVLVEEHESPRLQAVENATDYSNGIRRYANSKIPSFNPQIAGWINGGLVMSAVWILVIILIQIVSKS